MKSVISFVVLILALGVLCVPARTQEMAKKDNAPKPAASPSQAVLDSWNDIGRKLIAMAEDFPEDKYDFKTTPAQRSFAEQRSTQPEQTTSSLILLWDRNRRPRRIRSATSIRPRPT